MDRTARLAQGRSDAEDGIADHQAFVLAYSGHLREARKMSQHAVALAQQAAHPERAAMFETAAALGKASLGMRPRSGTAHWPRGRSPRIEKSSMAPPLPWPWRAIRPRLKHWQTIWERGLRRIHPSGSAICHHSALVLH